MIKSQEGTGYQGWRTKWPISSLGVVFVAFLVGMGIFIYQEYQLWTPLQRWYWYEYLSTHDFPTARGDYWVVMKTDARGRHSIATDADVIPDTTGQQFVPFQLTSNARQHGAVQLVIDTVHYSSAEMNQILAAQIFFGQTPDDLIRPGWLGALGFLVVGLVFAIPRD